MAAGLEGTLGPPSDWAVWVQFPRGESEPRALAFHGWEVARLELPIRAATETVGATRAEYVLYVTTEDRWVATFEVFNVRTPRKHGAALYAAESATWEECARYCAVRAHEQGFLGVEPEALLALLGDGLRPSS